jgi:hypothetical protein
MQSSPIVASLGVFNPTAAPSGALVGSPPDGERVLFSGASDDLIEVEGNIPGCDEYNVGTEALGVFRVAGAEVIVRLKKGGVWGIEVSQIDEDVPVEAVVGRMYAEGYSFRLELVVPKGSYVTKVF